MAGPGHAIVAIHNTQHHSLSDNEKHQDIEPTME